MSESGCFFAAQQLLADSFDRLVRDAAGRVLPLRIHIPAQTESKVFSGFRIPWAPVVEADLRKKVKISSPRCFQPLYLPEMTAVNCGKGHNTPLVNHELQA
jgi:hypothetical protein